MISFTISGSLPLHLPHAKYSVGVHAVAIVFETTAGSTKFETLYDIQGICLTNTFIIYNFYYLLLLRSPLYFYVFILLCVEYINVQQVDICKLFNVIPAILTYSSAITAAMRKYLQ